ncbi:Gfo/Idh/MocA family oxidoreductase [Haloferula sp.]|uniref:Gfo/Idh/MocA family oxidoreductase n=1 Tax=Haloferula sp. TaxID=2497595 RepID=UPI003C795EB3
MKPLTRRQTLKSLAAYATIQIVPSRVLGLNGQTPPSEELTRGIIGCGGISAAHLKMPGRLLSLCDVDSKHLAQRMADCNGEKNGVTPYHDYRELIAREDIDIVHICTPPHWHALMAIDAMKAGKDLWTEKPMSRTIGEGAAMVKAAEKYQRMVRLNTWFRFKDTLYGSGMRTELLKRITSSRILGWPLKVTVSGVTGFDWKFFWVGKTNLQEQPIPEELDYDAWLGPAPRKPYNAHRVHQTFRGYWDYDGGGLGDMGQHYLDPVQYLLEKDETAPIGVEIDADPQDADAVGTWRRITFTYADGCQIVLDGENRDKQAAYIEGPKGKVFKNYESDIPDLRKKIRELPKLPPMITDFHETVRTRKKFALNEENGFWSSTMVNLGIIAHRLNKNLNFDPETLTFDDAEATALVNQPMRGPWKL